MFLKDVVDNVAGSTTATHLRNFDIPSSGQITPGREKLRIIPGRKYFIISNQTS